jgi:hypothetical protein
MESDRQMIDDVVRLGARAAVLLRGVMVRKVDRQILEWGLGELGASQLMEQYFGRLVERPEYVPLLNILHLIYRLEGQLDYQVREYGLDSVKDDLAEINTSLRQAGEALEIGSVNDQQ